MKNEGSSSSSSSQITSSSKFSVDLNFNNNDNKNKIITYEKNKNKYIKTSDIVVSSENNLHQNMYLYLHSIWAINSVGSECLPYKEEVGGSSPSLPTSKNNLLNEWVFLCSNCFLFAD